MPEFYLILARKISKIPEFFIIFSRKINKIPNFTRFCPKNARSLHDDCPKNIFPEFYREPPPAPPPSVSYWQH